jgi:hypothetical protein
MLTITFSPKKCNPKFHVVRSVKVPPESCLRQVDREIGFYITHNGLSVMPGERPDAFQVRHCEAWIKRFARPRETVNFGIVSYGLKHLVEVWPFEGEIWPGRGYCTNGSFIEAALNLGYKFVSVGGEQSPNACFNMRFRRSRKYDNVYGREIFLPWDDPYLPFHEKAR